MSTDDLHRKLAAAEKKVDRLVEKLDKARAERNELRDRLMCSQQMYRGRPISEAFKRALNGMHPLLAESIARPSGDPNYQLTSVRIAHTFWALTLLYIEEKTLSQCGLVFEVSRERARQISCQGLRYLAHSSRRDVVEKLSQGTPQERRLAEKVRFPRGNPPRSKS